MCVCAEGSINIKRSKNRLENKRKPNKIKPNQKNQRVPKIKQNILVALLSTLMRCVLDVRLAVSTLYTFLFATETQMKIVV